jgi:hypothetical protein
MHPNRTPRLELRSWRAADLPLAEQLWGDARVTALIGGPFTRAQIRRSPPGSPWV